MKKIVKIIGLFLVLGLVFAIYKYYPQLEVLNGYAARTACSCNFVANRPMEVIKAEDLSMSPINLASVTINESEKSATSSVFGLSSKTAVFREDLGCILLEGKDDFNVNYKRSNLLFDSTYQYIKASTKEWNKDEISKIINMAFDEGMIVKEKMTRALLVLHKDTLVLEAYDKSTSEDTKLLGWSMTKSVTNAMIGLLAKQNKISITDKSLFSDWKDERSKISIDDLLKMKSGLEWEEDYSKVSGATTMLFGSEDMPKYASSVRKVDDKWLYSSGTSNLLSGIIRAKFSSLSDYHSFPYKQLFAPLGMRNSLIETDEAGNFIGSSYMYATARDWMRFGRLYWKKGNWQGKQILPENWVDYTVTEATGSGGKYGAHFWLNKNGSSYKDCPHDLYTADGYQGQFVMVIPSKDLVIVRLGLENIDMNALVNKIVYAASN